MDGSPRKRQQHVKEEQARLLAEHKDVVKAEAAALRRACADDDLKSVLDGADADAITAKTQALAQASMKLGEAMYAAQQSGDGAATQDGAADDVVDAEFEEVTDDGKKA
jgi:molecular chaperone DnaK